MSANITPQVGKRYVTRGGWVTPPLEKIDIGFFKFAATDPFKNFNVCWSADGRFHTVEVSKIDLISEYVEPTTDAFRRDLIARLYCELVMSTEHQYRSQSVEVLAESAISIADTLIEAMEATP